jgi:hypothetical protein
VSSLAAAFRRPVRSAMVNPHAEIVLLAQSSDSGGNTKA